MRAFIFAPSGFLNLPIQHTVFGEYLDSFLIYSALDVENDRKPFHSKLLNIEIVLVLKCEADLSCNLCRAAGVSDIPVNKNQSG